MTPSSEKSRLFFFFLLGDYFYSQNIFSWKARKYSYTLGMEFLAPGPFHRLMGCGILRHKKSKISVSSKKCDTP